MGAQQMAYLTHEARLMIAEEYRTGKRTAPLNGVMIRLIVQSLRDEHDREMSLRRSIPAP